jgi:dehydrogenase/reductase SDR family protein 12
MDWVGNNALEGLRKALKDNFTTPKASKALEVADKLILPGVWRFTRLGYTNSRKRWNALSAYMHDRHAVITEQIPVLVWKQRNNWLNSAQS